MTTFAGWTLLIGLFSSIAAIVGAYFIWLTLAATRDATKDANRAYLQVDAANIVLGHKTKGDAPSLTLHVRNSGNTPAVWFEVKCMYAIGQGIANELTGFDVLENRKILDNYFAKRWNGLSGNSELTVNAPQRLEDTLEMMNLDRAQWTRVIVYGSVRYRTFFDEEYESEFLIMGHVASVVEKLVLPNSIRNEFNKPTKLSRMATSSIRLFKKLR